MYRTSANPNVDEVVYSLDVVTAAGKHLLGFLMAFSIICMIMLGVTVFAGAPPAIEDKAWLMGLGAVAFAVPGIVVHRRRGRTLAIVRNGDTVRLRVESTELDFPVTLRGAQVTMQVEGVPMYECYLQVSDATKKGIVVGETRGAIHGKIPGWYEDGVDPEVRATAAVDVREKGQLAMLRDVIEKWNDRVAQEREAQG